MAPIRRTYGKKQCIIKIDKEDTFDKLFKSQTSNVFESSSDREATGKKSVESQFSLSTSTKSTKGDTRDVGSGVLLEPSWLQISDLEDPASACSKSKPKRKGTCSYFSQLSYNSSLKGNKAENSSVSRDVLEPSWSQLSELVDWSGPKPAKSKAKQKVRSSNRIRKKKKASLEKPALKFLSYSIGPRELASSTPKIVSEVNKKNLIEIDSEKLGRVISPIDKIESTIPSLKSSPTGIKSMHFSPKNLLGISSDIAGNDHEDSIDVTQEFFYGFPTLDETRFKKKLNLCQKITEMYVLKDQPKEGNGGKDSVKVTQEFFYGFPLLDETRYQEELNSCTNNTQQKSNNLEVNASVPKSTSLQNLNSSNIFEKDLNNMVKSSSFEHLKITKISDSNQANCKLNVEAIAVHCSELNIDSSDIEESVINSTDDRSYSMRSGQLDEEESILHTSDEECASGLSREKDSSIHKQLTKVDSETASDSFQLKDLEISGNVQSEDVSAEEGDLNTESEIAKSSPSIEVSRTTNQENLSSDVSTSSDKEILKDDGSIVILTCSNLNINDKLDAKQTTNYSIIRSCSAKSKDSFFSAENSASDDSERDCEYESDYELSCESNKSSRRSSLESTKSLTRETLEQLRETVCSLRIQDEYEDTICSKSRKSLTKRGAEWECPPSPRRSLFPLAPLFPLPENQEDPADDSTQAEGSMCDSATASEEDSNQSLSVRSKEEFGKSEETGRSSGEDDSMKHSPVREASRLRRSRRLSRKSRESESKLNMVIEESDSESTEAEVVQQIEHIVLPTGKKYRRSLTILRRLGEEDNSNSLAPKGRNYDLPVETVVNLQSKTGADIQEGRISLMNKRKSLLSQCQITPSSSPAIVRNRRSLHMVHTYSPVMAKRLSVVGTILEESVSHTLAAVIPEEIVEESFASPLSCKLSEMTIREVEEVPGDVSRVEELSLYYIPENASKSIVMKVCQQEEPISFSDILFGDWEEESMKIGEGVFGEVFMIPRGYVKNVIKIIPIEGNFLVNGEKQKTFSEICNELIIADSLSELRDENENFMSSGFAELVASSVVKGKYPKRLLELWDEFDETRGSENESPLIFGDDQLYLVLQLGNAGKDLESYSFSTAKQGLSVFKQTVCAMAVAEACYEFEHRDLHWGNVLVSRTSERDIPFILNKEKHTILTNGVKATIIDFTLSRMTFPSTDFPVYCNLGQDPDMFIGTGDYQFDVYRHMRDDLQNNWQLFVPKTNVRWLHYLIDKMINRVKYQRKTAKVHTDSMKILKDIESWILTCDNSVEVALKIVQYK